MMRCVLYFVLLLIVPLKFQAQEAKDNTRKTIFKVLPTAYYTPETRIAVEGFGYLSFYTKGSERASNVRVFAAVTQNRQITIDLPWQIFTSGERYRITGKWDFKKFPEYFYGIGNNTQEKVRALYTYRSTGIRNRVQKQIGEVSFLGIAIEGRWLDTDLPKVMLPNNENGPNIIGEHGYRFVGIGPTFIMDSRNAVLCPEKGRFFEATYLFNMGNAEADRLNYSKFILDYRRYFSLPKQLVIAFHGVAQSTIGDVPYRELPALGGPLLHRGYYFGRFRDKHLLASQVEVRKHLFWRLGVAAFGSVGRVYNDLETALMNHYHPAGGGGLRFKLSKNDAANIRFDVAVTPDSHGFYVYFAEAF